MVCEFFEVTNELSQMGCSASALDGTPIKRINRPLTDLKSPLHRVEESHSDGLEMHETFRFVKRSYCRYANS